MAGDPLPNPLPHFFSQLCLAHCFSAPSAHSSIPFCISRHMRAAVPGSPFQKRSALPDTGLPLQPAAVVTAFLKGKQLACCQPDESCIQSARSAYQGLHCLQHVKHVRNSKVVVRSAKGASHIFSPLSLPFKPEATTGDGALAVVRAADAGGGGGGERSRQFPSHRPGMDFNHSVCWLPVYDVAPPHRGSQSTMQHHNTARRRLALRHAWAQQGSHAGSRPAGQCQASPAVCCHPQLRIA